MEMDHNTPTPAPATANQGINTSMQSVPRVLLEIFVYGKESQKPEIKRCLDILENQIRSSKSNDYVRLFYYVDQTECKTVEEIKQWFLENCMCKYYIFANTDFTVKSDFVKDCITAIRKLEKSVATMKNMGIIVAPKKPEVEVKTEDAASENSADSEAVDKRLEYDDIKK